MKKYLMLSCAVLALGAAQPALATPTATVTPLSGVYIGAYGAYDWSNLDTAGPGANLRGWDWGGFAGYKLDAWLSGLNMGINGSIEGFYGTSNSDGHIGAASVRKDQDWGVSFRPGFSFINHYTNQFGLNPYFIVGYRNTEFGGAGASSHFDGFELGAGTELISWGALGTRLEYSHTWYDSNSGVNPDSNDVRIGLAYHF